MIALAIILGVMLAGAGVFCWLCEHAPVLDQFDGSTQCEWVDDAAGRYYEDGAA